MKANHNPQIFKGQSKLSSLHFKITFESGAIEQCITELHSAIQWVNHFFVTHTGGPDYILLLNPHSIHMLKIDRTGLSDPFENKTLYSSYKRRGLFYDEAK